MRTTPGSKGSRELGREVPNALYGAAAVPGAGKGQLQRWAHWTAAQKCTQLLQMFRQSGSHGCFGWAEG